MGNRDSQRRERKKPKKNENKTEPLGPVSSSPPVEVIPKGKAAKQPKE